MKVTFGKEKIVFNYKDINEELLLQDLNAENLVALLEKCVSSEPDVELLVESDISPFSNKLKDLIEYALKQEPEQVE